MPTKQDILDLLKDEPNDTFLLYALAMAQIAEGHHAQAVEAFDRVLTNDPGYSAAYYHKAKALIALARPAEAKATLSAGIPVATKKGDLKTVREMQDLMGLT